MTLLRHSSSVERSWKPQEKASALFVQPQPFQPVAGKSHHYPCSTRSGWGGRGKAPFQHPAESWHRRTNGVHNPRGGCQGGPQVQQVLWVPGEALTSFALAGGIQVVVGAQQLALAIDATVIDAGREVGMQVHLSCHVGARLKSAAQEKGVSPHPASLKQLPPPPEAPTAPRHC